jgi:hypothetical protein
VRRAQSLIAPQAAKPSTSLAPSWPSGDRRQRVGPSPDDIEVLVTGIGQEAASIAAASWVPRVRAVVVCGVAGGTGGAAGAGDVILASQVIDAAGTVLYAPALDDMSIPGVLVGPIASVRAPVDDAHGRAALLALGALAIETEAAAWSSACAAAGVPLVVVRAVLDTPSAPLGVAADLVRAGATGPRLGGLAPLLVRPAAWTPLLRLGRAATEAERAAAETAAYLAAQLLVTA